MATADQDVDHSPKRPADAGAFLFLAMNQRDALAVLAQPGEDIPILGLGLVFGLRYPHEATADKGHRPAGNDGVENRRQDKKAGNVELHAAEADVQCPANGPQHDNEGHGREEGLRDSAHEIDRRLCCDTHIIGDAVFGIGMVAAHEIELVVAAVADPAIHQIVVEPCAPTTLQRHTQISLTGAKPNTHREQNKIDQRQGGLRVDASLFWSPSKIALFQRFIA